MIDERTLSELIEKWIDPEKRCELAASEKALFRLLEVANDDLIKNVPKIAKIYPKMRYKATCNYGLEQNRETPIDSIQKVEISPDSKKIKFIAIGSAGANVFTNKGITIEEYPISAQESEENNSPFLALDTDICGFWWVTAKKILCGKELCRGLGCGGIVGRGYAAAHETLFHQMSLFYDNEVNVFILGLGGGTGTGILQYLLLDLYRARRDKKIRNKYNLVISTLPLDLDKRRQKRADIAIEEISFACDLLILIPLEKLSPLLENKSSIQELFFVADNGIKIIINNLLNLDQPQLFKFIQEYVHNNKVMQIDQFDQFQQCFANELNDVKNNVPINPHFTGQKRDFGQLKAINQLLSNEETFLFVGCSSGEELVDFQEIFKKSKAKFFGIDNNREIVERANEVKYTFPTKIFVADILMKEFFENVTENTTCLDFDVLMCRNLLVYYSDELVRVIIPKLAKLTRKFLVLGISDPFPYTVENDSVKIGDISFKVIDFDNRIFCLDKSQRSG